ncbi:hypothetical protein DNTS_029055 [Danionella cerebrum]|uniref:Uncharacterized protein n=1 Tax=Danionella cerebrum TaxID=2873325 RepID=A0A553N5M4_9TELE|nr:hypothetical protein DNTS_029055 [Danionella translucida]
MQFRSSRLEQQNHDQEGTAAWRFTLITEQHGKASFPWDVQVASEGTHEVNASARPDVSKPVRCVKGLSGRVWDPALALDMALTGLGTGRSERRLLPPTLLNLSAMFSTSVRDRVKMERTTFTSSQQISQERAKVEWGMSRQQEDGERGCLQQDRTPDRPCLFLSAH